MAIPETETEVWLMTAKKNKQEQGVGNRALSFVKYLISNRSVLELPEEIIIVIEERKSYPSNKGLDMSCE